MKPLLEPLCYSVLVALLEAVGLHVNKLQGSVDQSSVLWETADTKWNDCSTHEEGRYWERGQSLLALLLPSPCSPACAGPWTIGLDMDPVPDLLAWFLAWPQTWPIPRTCPPRLCLTQVTVTTDYGSPSAWLPAGAVGLTARPCPATYLLWESMPWEDII